MNTHHSTAVGVPPGSSAPAPTTQRIALITLVLGACAIGFAPIFVRLSEVGPAATAFYRLLIALPVFWLWANLERPAVEGPPRRWSSAVGLVLAGLFYAGDLALWHWSIRYTTVANATLLTNLAPIFVTAGAWLLFREHITRGFLVGLAIALTGTALLVGNGLSLDDDHLTGDLLGIASALFYGGYILTISRLRRRLSTPVIMFWVGTVSCLILLVTALISGEEMAPVTWAGWSVLAALALISHVGGQGLIAQALAHLPVSFSSVTLLLQPVIAALAAWALLSEALAPTQAMAGLVVLIGIMLARRGSRWP